MTETGRNGFGDYRLFTQEEDEYIIRHYSKQTHSDIGKALGRPRTAIQGRCVRLIVHKQIDARKRYYQPRWTKRETDVLQEKFGLVTDRYLARLLRRSVTGIRLKAKRLGLIKKLNLMTLRDVAKVFRVDDHKVRKWIYDGKLIARGAGFYVGLNRAWRVDGDNLEDFIKNNPNDYDPERIDPDLYPYYRSLAFKYGFPN